LHELINGQNGVVFAAEIDGVVVGGMAGGIVDQWFNDDLIAYDYSIFIEPSRRSGITAIRLVKAFEEWARIKGAKIVQLGIGTKLNVEGTSKLYQSLGFEVFAPLFQKEIK
jgi:GNAT superfamily N-acetyltransferase